MTEAFKAGGPDWNARHLAAYLETGGEVGHYVDFTPVGGPAHTPCLILETVGRKSGEQHMLPLIYGTDEGRFVIVASKGGAPAHPAWYLNLVANPAVTFQVAATKYAGVAHTVDGAEHARLYAMMAEIYPPYVDYQRRAERVIPVVLLTPDVTTFRD